MSTISKWMHLLKNDIQQKYNDAQPLFIVHDKYLYINEVIRLFEKENIHHSILYKKSFDGYILKYFPPSPPVNICQNEIDLFFHSLPKKGPVKLFQISTNELYSEKEAKSEILKIFLLTYYTKIVVDKTIIKDDKNIYKISVHEDSIENMFERKLLYFEYNEKMLNNYQPGA